MKRFQKLRKAWIALAACAGLGTPLLAAADAPAPAPAPNARTLATVEAILAYCARVDPSSVDKYEQQRKALVRGTSEEELATVRDSDDYRQARESVNAFVSAVDEHNSKKVCAESVATNR